MAKKRIKNQAQFASYEVTGVNGMPIKIVFDRAEVVVGRRVVGGLTITELRLLSRLNQGGLVSRGALLMSAWSGKTIKWNNASRRLDVAICRLRAKTGIDIVAVPGEGYRI